ncbi:P-loop containing nucleoside triphosphate hydrolase protein [Hortaea werneckii]|nr:P-loop containing nucleoside triphosphate hydrolase protein [Hortaea werneckii]KAI7624643.1 P-loop containing nucleoside triphosphate hydrolase protein [Hortaea werneckii]KAI7634725.1 P-loop containing nucleoside triphosphate hydrolase protein [Hortaea werneckii]KAI7679825.1 P-loop containing nucleoside triphosphate hydrolase protein [Hortaea werneckii]KAI7717206.1 P-loop containing nucleoside triphosphate hydrolase protein [Hortaea werneckii]
MVLQGSAQRLGRLKNIFFAFIDGKRTVSSGNEAVLFIESVCAQEDKRLCIEKLASSSHGLGNLRTSMRMQLVDEFINGAATNLILYLDDPAVELLCAGGLRKKVLVTMLDPPTFWNDFVAAAMTKRLRGKAEYAFSWVLLLLLCWTDSPLEVDGIAQKMVDANPFLESADDATKKLVNRIEHALAAKHANLPAIASGPGGRHDNDKVDYRQISLFPTQQELACKEKPYYRRADDLKNIPMASRVHAHLDNQFRLLREDFLAELREEVNVASKVSGPCRNMRLRGLEFLGTYFGDDRFATPFAMVFSVRHGLEAFANLPENQRKAHLNNNPKFLPREAFGCILQGGEVVSFATLLRAEEPLMEEVPAVTLVVPGTEALERVLSCVFGSSSLDFVLMSTPVFAYEPILRCLQTKLELPLSDLLLSTNEDERVEDGLTSEITPCDLTEALLHSRTNVQDILNLPKPVQLDESQLKSLVAGLRQSVSLIQGPPGTGKSFTGALLAKALFDNTNESILVLCYTNHALNQFLEDLIDIGIDQSSMVRLGSKSSGKTEPLSLRNRTRGFSHPFDVINDSRNTMNEQKAAIEESLTDCLQYRANTADMLSYLEFAEDDWAFFYALKTPGMGENEEIVGPKGKKVTQTYVFDRWLQGKDAGIFVDQVHESHDYVWQMNREARRAKWTEWEAEQRKELLTKVNEAVKSYNKSEALLRKAWTQQHGQIIRDKRIVACTTTAAAKYTEHIQSASPGVILVEEAGEILESHVLTAMTPSVRQLILIGDHQQLRPKVKAYALSVEKGDGYDLNRSLFERLILAGFPHTTLQEQYRMCPEISSLVRHLGYPSLRDAPSTLEREPVRGIDSRVVFIDHRKPERAAPQIADRRDQGATVSKQNQWEVAMVLKIVRYMAQQGYGTSDQVVLTPYLGQLHLLRNELAEENDPVLNNLDSFDLVQAGLMIAASAAHNKRPISISTIDNYQGEESDIVIVSLTRSNANGDIGFMSSPERLNVLLSRARKALILIGNSETFMARTKGAATWKPLFDTLASNGDMHDGLPVSCSQHPNWHRVMTESSDFEKHCPDGGCSEPCGIDLACKIHKCPQKCHKAIDHSKLKCKQYVHDQCPKGHTIAWQCFTLRPSSCSTCDTEARRLYEKQQRDLALEKERQARQQAYKKQLAEIDDEIDRQRRLLKDAQDEVDRRNTIHQRMQDLENVQSRVQQQKDATISQVTRDAVSGNDPAHNPSASASALSSTPANTKGTTAPPLSLARDDWDRQKQLDGAKNAALDKLMAMTGLENVKQAFLDIKASIDLKVRQNADMSKQRFGAALLGNPGTGKTTVARLYAEFLTNVGALPGDHVIETTGSKLANEGVSGCKKMIEEIQNTGGGALFIDEAYQLSSGSSYSGAAVLDFLLAEVENLTKKVVFILAGYNKEMESFFSHNSGIPSRFPRSLQFADYEDTELLDIMTNVIHKRYGGRMEYEDGVKGLFARTVARRIGRGRGRPGFGNARAVENEIANVEARQAKRINKARRAGQQPSDFFLTKEDLIGPEPSDVLKDNKTWAKLKQLVGLQAVKESVNALFASMQTNYERQLQEQPLIDFDLNRVFLGSPGTGKTTVAKLYGQILADLGFLSNGEVIVKSPADFVGNVLGASEANTKGILQSARGKVLVIDEAYGLYAGSGGGAGDPYKAAVIDTIVAEVQSVPGDDQCVLLLGYNEQMEEMMQNANPGLARRFPIDSAFIFEDFDDQQIAQVLDFKLQQQGLHMATKARTVALQSLSRARDRPHFGNAGEVDIILNKAKINQQKRIAKDRTAKSTELEAIDVDPDFRRTEKATTDFALLFRGFVNVDKIVEKLNQYQRIAANARHKAMDPKDEIPFNFLFRGPPGTGKTSIARKMGKVYYDMGFLSTAQVVECSAKDLMGEYAGQTGPKTDKLVESALGKILFIDEAYRLAEGSYAKEDMDQLVDCVTKPKFFQKLIIILAGYEKDINHLMSVNPGLTSRFPETIDFAPMRPEHCLEQLVTLLQQKGYDISALAAPSEVFKNHVLTLFGQLGSLENFGNGRDVKTLAKSISSDLLSSVEAGNLCSVVTEDSVISALEKMINERTKRAEHAVAGALRTFAGQSAQLQYQQSPPALPHANISSHTAVSHQTAQNQHEKEPNSSSQADEGDDLCNIPTTTAVRDAGVSDAIWKQLQRDKLKVVEEARELERLADEERRLHEWLKECADAEKARKLAEIERKKKELEERKRQEAAEQKKLMQMGLCPVGYHWIRQSGGYRCAGGSHWVSERDVGKWMGR